jgi:CheY-like chemotaxis protein
LLKIAKAVDKEENGLVLLWKTEDCLRQEQGPLADPSFSFRILIVEDDLRLREVGKLLLESQGYEVHVAGDGFEALIALKRSLPDIIISDLSMPNMNGFELLSVVRRRFATIPVIVISGEFSGLTLPESVLADAFFAKGQYKPEALFEKILELIRELPPRPRTGRPDKAAVWVKNNRGIIAVTCTDCLRTFPVLDAVDGVNTVQCEFCACVIRFEIIGHHRAS